MSTPNQTRSFERLACGSPEHGSNRRQFLLGGAATALGVSLGGFEAGYNRAWADELKTRKKRVLLLWLAGGASQFETWDPKPGVSTGGPFNAIQTSATGVQICELLPKMAQLMHHTALIRSLDTKIGDHGGAADLMDVGRTKEPGVSYPDFGTVISKELETRDSDVPDYVSLYLATEGRRRPRFYGHPVWRGLWAGLKMAGSQGGSPHATPSSVVGRSVGSDSRASSGQEIGSGTDGRR